MKAYFIDTLSDKDIEGLCQRQAVSSDGASTAAQTILEKVKSGGDEALFALGRQYDKAELRSLAVSPAEIKKAVENLDEKTKNAFKLAAGNIEKFHKAQLTSSVEVETTAGVVCSAEKRPIQKVGLYIPGGTASLPSTVLMLAIPARLAGCDEIVLCTPPQPDGSVADSILYAADLCGVPKIYKVGGAQAIGAMAYGSETVPKVFKIFGPGNQYVTSAKMLVSIDADGAAIDMPAGPTELLVIADKAARADFVASDLLSQAEHGSDSQVVLVCTDEQKTKEIIKELEKQISSLPRKAIAAQAIKNSFALIVSSLDQAIDFSNRFAPEHLILNFEKADSLTEKIMNAGSVFVGPYSCESAGDYASGTNHCLPTYGYARAYSGVSVSSFQKQITFQTVTSEGAKNIGPAVSVLAGQELLEAHKRAMEFRL